MSDHSAAPLTARLQLLGAALLFSTGPTAIKACALSPWQVAGTRSGIAALAVLVLLPGSRRLSDLRLWGVALCFASTLVCYAVASKLTTAANAIFLQSTAPLYLLLLSPLLLREKARRADLLFMAVVLAGMALLFLGDVDTTAVASNPALGNTLALVSGLFWALSLIGMRWLERGRPKGQGLAAPAVVAGNSLAFLACIPFALAQPGGLVMPTAGDALILVYLGVVQIGLAYLFLTRGIAAVSAIEASLLLMLEPVLAPLWAWAVHGERPSGWALAGGAIILGATLARTLLQSAAPRRTPPVAPSPG